jgi:phosphoenolpyruvate synthase/pyruvate phosphate dikinase
MSSPVIEQKTDSLVPAPDKYRHIEIPADFQNRPALKDQEQLIISLAKIARNLEDQYGGHRLEFDETIIDGKKTFVIIEAVPFEVHNNSYEKLKPFGEKITLPLNIITSEAGIQALPSNELAIVHLPPEMFKGNELRPNLTNLAITAKAKGIPLVVLVAGNTATQHAVRNLIDDGHVVWFTEGEQFKPGEKIRLFKKPDGDYDWERENPIVMQGQMKGREVKRIGGKAKGMYELEKHGFPTPNRFVLETSVFRRIIEDLGLSDEFVKLDQLSATDTLEEIAMLTDSIQEKILNSSTDNIPDLEEALAQIGGDTFAVRSSAILEDGKVSLAGVYKTKLNVGKDGLRKAILQVLASAVSPLAVKSALGMDFKPSEASIAVIIQSMVQGPATGTVFTKDHLKRNDKLIRIEAARLGEQIVDDSATEDDAQKILIDKKTGRIKSNEFPVLGPILSDEQIDELVAQGLAIQSALGGPQDIEWAVDENGKIIFLQTRPL